MDKTKDSKQIAKELGSRGGKKTLERHGREHFKKIIKKRWDKERAKKKEQENQPQTD